MQNVLRVSEHSVLDNDVGMLKVKVVQEKHVYCSDAVEHKKNRKRITQH